VKLSGNPSVKYEDVPMISQMIQEMRRERRKSPKEAEI
jgi:hypothetical protein